MSDVYIESVRLTASGFLPASGRYVVVGLLNQSGADDALVGTASGAGNALMQANDGQLIEMNRGVHFNSAPYVTVPSSGPVYVYFYCRGFGGPS